MRRELKGANSSVSDFAWVISKWLHMPINMFVTLRGKRCNNTGLYRVTTEVKRDSETVTSIKHCVLKRVAHCG